MSTNYPQVGGYPQYPQYPQYTPPAYRLYDVGAVALAALGAPLAGTILIASNYRKLGQGGNAFLALLLGAAASAVEIYLALTSAKNPGIAALVLFAVTWFAANELQGSAIKTHVAWGGQLYSKWRGVGVGILTSLVLGAGFVAYLYHTGQLQKFITQAENQQKQLQTPQNPASTPQNTVTIGTKDQVVYSGTATANDATALGNALKTAGYFQDRGVTIAAEQGCRRNGDWVRGCGWRLEPGRHSRFIRGDCARCGIDCRRFACAGATLEQPADRGEVGDGWRG